MKKLFFTFLAFLIASLTVEVVILILTKTASWDNFATGRPFLAAVHVHLMVLGTLFFLIQMLLEKNFSITSAKWYRIFYIVYLVGVSIVVSLMFYKGVCQLYGAEPIRGLTEGGAAVGHSTVFAGLFLFAACLYQRLKPTWQKKDN